MCGELGTARTSAISTMPIPPRRPAAGAPRQIGTFDSLNPFILQGTPATAWLGLRDADGSLGRRAVLGIRAPGTTIAVPDDRSFVRYGSTRGALARRRAGDARGRRLVLATLREKGTPLYRYYYRRGQGGADGEREVTFSFAGGDEPRAAADRGPAPDPAQALVRGRASRSRRSRRRSAAGLQGLASMPDGRSTFERVADYWGRALRSTADASISTDALRLLP